MPFNQGHARPEPALQRIEEADAWPIRTISRIAGGSADLSEVRHLPLEMP
jgi:hypothetical protein